MKLPFISTPRRDYAIEPLTQAHAQPIALLHREDFARPWSAGEFLSLIVQDGVFGFVAREVGKGRQGIAGFVLARMAADEAEILTVAVARNHRRAGLGRALMDAVLRTLHHDRAEALFLEVDETNRAALALYRRLGFAEVGKRPGYYTAPDGTKTGALVLRRSLR